MAADQAAHIVAAREGVDVTDVQLINVEERNVSETEVEQVITYRISLQRSLAALHAATARSRMPSMGQAVQRYAMQHALARDYRAGSLDKRIGFALEALAAAQATDPRLPIPGAGFTAECDRELTPAEIVFMRAVIDAADFARLCTAVGDADCWNRRPPNTSVLHSGDRSKVAMAWALLNGAATVEMTPLGRMLELMREPILQLHGRNGLLGVWRAASRAFVESASGAVRVFAHHEAERGVEAFLAAASKLSQSRDDYKESDKERLSRVRVFWGAEWDELLSNARVDEIVFMDRFGYENRSTPGEGFQLTQ